MKNYHFKRADWMYGAVITGIIAVLVAVLALVGLSTRAFDPIGMALENYHISDGFFYTRALAQDRETERINPDVYLVDIKDCDTREEIAEIVTKINESEPRLLAVDIIFGKAAALAAEEDSALVTAFRGAERLILSQRVVETPEGSILERSFFADEVDCVEGDVSFDFGTVRSFGPTITVGGETYPSFIARIAAEGGICRDFKEQLINYSPVRTVRIGPEALPAPDLLQDGIVLLGDSGDLRDFHHIPVLMDGQARTSGMNIIAQALYTLRPGKGYTSCPGWLTLLISLVLTYLFCTFIAAPMFRIGQFNGLWIAIWQVAVLVVLLLLTYCLFWWFRFHMPLTWWLVGVGLAGLATELFYFITKRDKAQ